MFNLIIRRWGLSSREGNVLIQLLLLAVTVLAYNVMAMAIANSLFVNYIGANSLPLAFILIGLCSMPAYGLFSTAIDSYSRPKLFRFVLVISITIAIGLRFLLNFESMAVYYGLLIAVFFQWDFYNNILYPSLVIDYFTAIEYKRYAPFIGMAQAVGTLLGGGLTIVLCQYLPTRDLLWGLPFLLVITFAQIVYLEKSQPRINTITSSEKISLIASIKSFPHLAAEYPLVWLLASSSFLLVIIYLSSEFLWFNIYGSNFSEQELTSFLGLMRIVISLVQVGVLYGITRPLLKVFGVANLNGVYPVTTLISFAGLLFNLKLPAAIGLHLNGDAFYKGINLPIHQLNYNGIPSEFRGRIRALSDGLIYSLGLTLAGIILWFAHNYLSLLQITALAAVLTFLLLLVRLPMGNYYAQGLEQMIRADMVDLDDLANAGIQLPSQSKPAIQEMLLSSDGYLQLKALELVGNLGQVNDFLPEIKQILDDQEGNDHLAAIALQNTQHSQHLRRIIAWKIIELIPDESILPHLAKGLTDADGRVREQVAKTIAAYGSLGLPVAQKNLVSSEKSIVDTAIAALGKIGTKQAKDILYNYLADEFAQLSKTQKWQQQIPDNDPIWQPLKIAIADYHQRLIDRVLYILSCLGRSRTVNAIRSILASQNEKDLANAVEVLASMQNRRFIVPLIPILEQQLKPQKPIPQEPEWLKNKGYKILLEALATQDRWLKSGALIALASIPTTALTDNDPIVSAIAQDLFTLNQFSKHILMNRLLLLKEVSLFKNLSLDELLAIEKVLTVEQVLAEQTIYTEGSWGSHFYIVSEGTVQLSKKVGEQPQAIKQVVKGQYFGEIAIFDDAPRWDTAIALENSTLLKLEKKRFINLIAQRPHIILEICRFLSQRLRETDKYLSAKK